jgi:hypothetical protein
MAIQKIFRSAMPSFRYFFRNGTAAIFMSGRYTTDQKDLEDELMQEVGEIGTTKSRHPFIYIDEKEPELDTEALSPLELIEQKAYEKARAELLREMAEASARANDAQANVSSTTANFASSLNNSAKIEASMGTDVTMQALATATATAQDAAQTQDAGAKLASLKAKLSSN